MILISIHPFAIRKLFLIIVAVVCFSAVCFADPVLMVRRYATPSEWLDALETTSSTRQKSLGAGAPEVAKSPSGDLESIDSAPDESGAGSAEWIGLSIPLRSFLFPSAACVFRFKDSTANLADGLGLRAPGNI